MELVNKVAQSGIITLDLETYFPREGMASLDISTFLFRGLLLKEKDFREAIKAYDWQSFSGKKVAVYCSTDAIIAQWAFMLIASALIDAGAEPFSCTPPQLEQVLLLQGIKEISAEEFTDQKVVIKGCGTRPLPDAAYLEITKKLKPVVKTLMFGEPCSTVPVYKRR